MVLESRLEHIPLVRNEGGKQGLALGQNHLLAGGRPERALVELYGYALCARLDADCFPEALLWCCCWTCMPVYQYKLV